MEFCFMSTVIVPMKGFDGRYVVSPLPPPPLTYMSQNILGFKNSFDSNVCLYFTIKG